MKKFLLLFGLFIAFFVNAQDKIELSAKLLKVNFMNPGVSYEVRLSKNTSLSFDDSFAIGSGRNRNYETKILAAPFIRSQYRMYYNLEKRVRKGKNILGNSGNYLAIHSSYYFRPMGNDLAISPYNGFMLGGVWGFQKTYKNNINLGSNLGLAYQFGNTVLPVINFTIGYVLLK